MDSIRLDELGHLGMRGVSHHHGMSLSEAAIVCLDSQGHESGVLLKMSGSLNADCELIWDDCTTVMKATYNDANDATADGAYCVAILMIYKYRQLKVWDKSPTYNGYDYSLVPLDITDDDGYVYEGTSRLEVSGIRNGDAATINQRIKEKVDRLRRNRNSGTVFVVEFGKPVGQVVES